MDLIQEGINKKLIKFDYENKYITYIHQNKRRNYTKPEEKVQAESFVKLVVQYNYAPERIAQFVPVTMGSDTREADIIVYNDDKCTSAHIVVECKKEEVSEREFKQAIKQAFSYAATGTVRAKYFWVTSKIKDEYFQIFEEKPKERISNIPQYGVKKLPKFKYVKGGGESNGQTLPELNVVTEYELTRRFKQAHNALWGGGELNPSEAFDELDKLIFCKIWDERKPRKPGEAYDFQIFSENTKTNKSKNNEELQKRIHSLYNEGRVKEPKLFTDDIRLSPEKLCSIVSYFQDINLVKTDLDSKGRAFEAFMGSFFRGDFGQYFTPRPIVNFIVDTLPIKNDSLVLDTSCGSGGFLLYALDKIRKQASEYYPNFEINPDQATSHYKHWHGFAEKNLYGIEINEQIARAAKMNMIIHDDGHTNVIAADGLLPANDFEDENGTRQNGIASRADNKGFAYNRFDFIITNPPFGSSIKQTEQAYMHQYGYALKKVDWLDTKDKATPRNKQSTEVLFIEQCHKFLTEGGYLAIVIPDGILTNSSLQYVRDDIEDKYRIIAVVSLPQTAFQATGAGVKSSVMFLRKHTAKMTQNIQNKKTELQDKIKDNNKYLEQCQQIDDDKKKDFTNLKGFKNPENLQGTDLIQSKAYKEWKKEVSAEYKEKVEALKETLSEQYLAHKKLILDDYPIFMAIAEEIGYDATGKDINNNELEIIGQELKRFITDIKQEEI